MTINDEGNILFDSDEFLNNGKKGQNLENEPDKIQKQIDCGNEEIKNILEL